MKRNAKAYEVTVTIEEVAKARHFGDSADSGLLFILEKGLTNLSRKSSPLFSGKRFVKPKEA